jgi:hypothetical protein
MIVGLRVTPGLKMELLLKKPDSKIHSLKENPLFVKPLFLITLDLLALNLKGVLISLKQRLKKTEK